MPRIAVDLSRLKTLHCGLGQHALHIGRQLQHLQRQQPQALPVDRHWDLTLLVPPGPAGAEVSLADSPARRFPLRVWHKEQLRHCVAPFRRWSVVSPPCDLWHRLDHLSAYEPPDRDVPVVQTIHDLNFPRGTTEKQVACSLRKLQRRVDRSCLVTTISHFAAGQIRERLQLGSRAVRVVYLGASIRPPTDLPAPRFAPRRPFLFSLGEFRPSKNFHVLIEFLRTQPGLALVIAGNLRTAYGAQVVAQVERSGLADRIVLPGIVSDDERQWLYQHCEAFLFPSLAEGFGLPVIEAMSLGKPVFLARATSLPEIGGDLAAYWTDESPPAMAAVFEQGMQRAGRSGFADQLRAHASRFSWENAARDYLQVYHEALGQNTAPNSRERPAHAA